MITKPSEIYRKAHGGTKEQFSRYDLNGDGVLDKDEMAKRAAVQHKAALEMKHMDKNKDGRVDLAEFLAAGGTEDEYRKYDVNRDGVLDASEMKGIGLYSIPFAILLPLRSLVFWQLAYRSLFLFP